MNRLHQYVARLLHLPSDASRSFGKLRLEESINRMDSSIETVPKAEWIHDGMTDSEIVKAVYYGTFPLHILSLDIDRNMELTFHNEKLWIISFTTIPEHWMIYRPARDYLIHALTKGLGVSPGLSEKHHPFWVNDDVTAEIISEENADGLSKLTLKIASMDISMEVWKEKRIRERQFSKSGL